VPAKKTAPRGGEPQKGGNHWWEMWGRKKWEKTDVKRGKKKDMQKSYKRKKKITYTKKETTNGTCGIGGKKKSIARSRQKMLRSGTKKRTRHIEHSTKRTRDKDSKGEGEFSPKGIGIETGTGWAEEISRKTKKKRRWKIREEDDNNLKVTLTEEKGVDPED